MTPACATALPRKAILLSFSLACLPYEQKAFAQANDCAVLLARPPLTGCAAKFAAPGLDDTAVKRLTKEQARNIVAWLHLQGKLTLNEPFVPRFDASCKLVSPGAGDVLSIKWCFRGPKGIVEYKADMYDPPRRDSFHKLDPRLIVGMYRLAARLNQDPGVKEIWNRGTQPGKGDIHMEGRAFDFSGALLSDGKTSISVQRGWTEKRPFFESLYGYLIKQYCHGSAGGKLGESSQVVTPSDPDPKQAKDHFDHVHFDVPKGELCPKETPEIE